jgi:hypothetical protein
VRDDDVRLRADRVGGELVQLGEASLRRARIDGDLQGLDGLPEIVGWRGGREQSDAARFALRPNARRQRRQRDQQPAAVPDERITYVVRN